MALAEEQESDDLGIGYCVILLEDKSQTHKPYANNDINVLSLVTFPFTVAISVISMNKHEKKTFHL